MNIVMVVADTVINDYLGVHGGPVETPNIDAFAREAVDFTDAQAASFPTVPARADFLTGRYALTDIGWGPLPPGVDTVPEHLSAAGTVCAAVVDTPFFKVKGYNYDRGFKYFADLPLQDVARLSTDPRVQSNTPLLAEPWQTEHDHCAPVTFATAERHLELLATSGNPFFLYVDTWDPHEPWDAPAWYTRRYLPDYDGRVVNPAYARFERLEEFDCTVEDVEIARACYCGKLTMVDRWFGRFMDHLDAMGLADDTAVIFTTDHGFYLGERDIFGKMLATAPTSSPDRRWLRSPLYHELVNVPFMVRVPGVAARTDDRLVSAIDIAPTLLDLAGAPPPDSFLGRSLVPLLHSTDEAGDELAISAMPLAIPGEADVSVVDDVTRTVLEWQPITMTTADWTLLHSTLSEPAELYDRKDDPHQQTNVADSRPDVVEKLRAALKAELVRAGAGEDHVGARF